MTIVFRAYHGVIITESNEHLYKYHYACPYCGWVQRDVTHTRTEAYKGTCKCPSCWIRFKVSIGKKNILSEEEIHAAKLKEYREQRQKELAQLSFLGKIWYWVKFIFS